MTASNGTDLVLLTNGFAGAVTSIVGANSFAETTSMFFTDDDKTGIGLDLVDLAPVTGVADIMIFDTAGNFLGSTTVNTPTFPTFWGVWSSTPIGEINVAGGGGGGELLDNIQMWVPEPATLTLLALGGLAMIRRR